ncbi:MAG: MG2 domain-containing protein [Bacteroidales bacterium]|nr:MG2 domain-containing protein [Bacteroidales bacterium]
MKHFFLTIIFLIVALRLSSQEHKAYDIADVKQRIDSLRSNIVSAEKKGYIQSSISSAEEIFSIALKIDDYQEAILAKDDIIKFRASQNWKTKTAAIKEFTEKVYSIKDSTARAIYKASMLEYLGHSMTGIDNRVTIEEFIDDILANTSNLKSLDFSLYSKLIDRELQKTGYSRLDIYEYCLLKVIHALNCIKSSNFYFRYSDRKKITQHQNKIDSLYKILIEKHSENPADYIIYVCDQIDNMTDNDSVKILKYNELLELPYNRNTIIAAHNKALTLQRDLYRHKGKNLLVKKMELYEFCRLWIDKEPKNSYLSTFTNIKGDIESKSIYINHSSRQIYPGIEHRLSIQHKNIPSISVKIFRLPEYKDLGYSSGDTVLIKTDTIDIVNKRFGVYQYTSYKINIPQEGLYYVTASSLNDSLNNSVKISVCKNSAVIMSFNNQQTLTRDKLYVTDFKTGEPIERDSIFFYKEVAGIGTKGPRYQLVTSEVMEFNGFTTLPLVKDIGTEFYYTIGRYGPLNRYYERSVSRSDVYNKIFTDRKLYSPKDTIHFKAFSYKLIDDSWKINSEQEIEIILKNHENTSFSKKLKTNEFGTADGYFILPENSKKGYYYFPSAFAYSNLIRVEEYKRPNFKIICSDSESDREVGDTVRIRGQVVSYAGFPLKNASVKIETNRELYGEVSINRSRDLLYYGIIQTDSAGCFNIQFPSVNQDDSLTNKLCGILLSTNIWVTDLNGETHNRKLELLQGVIYTNISDNIYSLICKEDNPDIIVSAERGFIEKEKTNLPGIYQVFSDDKLCIEGSFTSNIPFRPDWEKLKSGNFQIKYRLTERNGFFIRDSSKFTLFSIKDEKLQDNISFLFYPSKEEIIKPGNLIDFILGSDSLKLNAYVSLVGKDSILCNYFIKHDNGIKRYSIDYKSDYPEKISLNITLVQNNILYTKLIQYKRPSVTKGINIEFLDIAEKYEPGASETFKIVVKDKQGAPLEGAEVLVSIFDETTDRFEKNNYNPQLMSYGNYYHNIHGNNMNSANLDVVLKNYHTPIDVYEESEEEWIPYAVVDYDRSYEIKSGEQRVRKSFRETIAFLPNLKTDSNGEVNVPFIASDLLSTFRVLAFANTKDLLLNSADTLFVLQKDVMVQTNIPKFLREGDTISIISTLINNYDENLHLSAGLNLFGSIDNEHRRLLPQKSQQVNLASKNQIPVKWRVSVPSKIDSLGITLSVKDKAHFDAEEHLIPVIPKQTDIIRTKVIALDQSGNFKFDFSELSTNKESEGHVKVVINNPLNSAIESLKEISNLESQNFFDCLSAYFAKAYFKSPDLNTFREKAIPFLASLTKKNSFFSWYPGMDGTYYLSFEFLEKMKQIYSICSIKPTPEEEAILRETIESLDSHFVTQYKLHLERKQKYNYNLFATFNVLYLRARALYPEYPLPEKVKIAKDYYISQMDTMTLNPEVLNNVYYASALLRNGEKQKADRYIKSIRQYAVKNSTTGIYFPNAVLPYRGFVNSELSAHADLLDLFASAGDEEMVAGIGKWLMLQKENQLWQNPYITTDVVYNTLKSSMSGISDTPTTYQLSKKRDAVYVKKNNKYQEFIYIHKNTKEDNSKMKKFSNGIDIQRRFFKIDMINGEEILSELKMADDSSSTKLRPGDRILVEYTINSTENRSYVKISANNAACLLPCDECSGYRENYYREIGKSALYYNFELLPEGESKFKELFYVTQEGTFSSSVSIVESIFNPAFRGNSEEFIIRSGK